MCTSWLQLLDWLECNQLVAVVAVICVVAVIVWHAGEPLGRESMKEAVRSKPLSAWSAYYAVSLVEQQFVAALHTLPGGPLLATGPPTPAELSFARQCAGYYEFGARCVRHPLLSGVEFGWPLQLCASTGGSRDHLRALLRRRRHLQGAADRREDGIVGGGLAVCLTALLCASPQCCVCY